MTYTERACFSCGSPWSGYGNICNACRQINVIQEQASIIGEQVAVAPAPTVVKVEYASAPASEDIKKPKYFTVGDTAIDKSIRRHLNKYVAQPAKVKRSKWAQKTTRTRSAVPLTVDNDVNYEIIIRIISSLIVLWICSLGNWVIPKSVWLIFKVGIWCMGGFFFMDSPF